MHLMKKATREQVEHDDTADDVVQKQSYVAEQEEMFVNYYEKGCRKCCQKAETKFSIQIPHQM